MPDVGLTTATQPLSREYRVIIKYSVEVEGLPVYNETYNVDTLAKELKWDEETVQKLWLRRLRAPIEARRERAFSATLTTKLAEGTEAERR